ncbi:MAG TPA: hypothetical protein VD713_01855 [Sphingomonadales bacterium]|nr:hypothetical protein [Sphingomonadales bacterium]
MTPRTLAKALAGLPVAALYEAAGRRGALPPYLKPIGRARQLAGPAFPVRCTGSSNIAIHRAVYAARPGDVLVIAQDRRRERALIGDMLVLAAKLERLGGIVLDGFVRDVADLERMNFPIFCRGGAVEGPLKTPKPSLKASSAIRIESVTVCRGDFVRGDADGVVILPQCDLKSLLAKAKARLQKEKNLRLQMKKSGKRLGTLLGIPLGK